MISVPGFLLRRLYVKGSLKNEGDGFRFELRNRLGSGYAHKLWPLKVDGEELAAGSTFFIIDDLKTAFADVSRESTFTLAMNTSITISAEEPALAAGPHRLEMAFDVPGLGTLRFDFTDAIGDE
jgi:hydroxymethylglutaryl-CoA reductase (NADPH)